MGPDLPRDVLEALLSHCRACWPDEAVGAIVELPSGTLAFRPLTNVVDRHHATAPHQWPNSARHAFLVAPGEWMALERAPGQIRWLCHSHIDAHSRLSTDDLAYAAPGGTPLLKGLGLVVVAMSGRNPTYLSEFTWKDGRFAIANELAIAVS